MNYNLTHLRQLEAESIHILREVVAECENPVMLYSIGKDSSVLLHLAVKAFAPGKLPFPLMHIDTTFKFPEMIAFRDRTAKELGVKLIVKTNHNALEEIGAYENWTCTLCATVLKTQALVEGLQEGGFDAAFGGARRDEEQSRAKERILSFRDGNMQWDPKNQRPELWNIFNGRHQPGEHLRGFPISNWTELDVWQYIAAEKIELPMLYFSHERDVYVRDGVLLAYGDFMELRPEETLEKRRVRFRTIGDMTCTGAVESPADSLDDIVAEVAYTRTTERGARADDKRSEAAMEDRKKKGYF